jgi:hypothetical protein
VDHYAAFAPVTPTEEVKACVVNARVLRNSFGHPNELHDATIIRL